MRIAMMGTRGVPARYGGFETAVEEIGSRLAAAGHDVTVYCRATGGEDVGADYAGMHRRQLPTLRAKALETLSHTALSSIDQLMHQRFDVAFVFNAANAPFLPLIRRRGTAVAVHVDGLEWKRAKWGGAGRNYYRMAESLSVRWADALIADARGIADYYTNEFGATTEQIAYGADISDGHDVDGLEALGLTPNDFHVVVARFEPENHVDLIIRGYLGSRSTRPLIVVGSAPYSDEHSSAIRDLAGSDERVRLLGSVWDQHQLDQLYAHATTYLHGHSVGGTNPSLLRAMGMGTSVIAYDVVFNRETLGNSGVFFETPDDLAKAIDEADSEPEQTLERGAQARAIVAERYQWDDIASEYEALARRLAAGSSRRGEATGHRVES